jgi:hypothetical protein
MKNTWLDEALNGSALSGPMLVPGVFRGFHPRLFMLFAFGESMGIRFASPLCLGVYQTSPVCHSLSLR